MPAIDLTEINFLAVIAAALAAFFIGGAWYTALFGKAWIKSRRYTDAQVQEMKKRRPPGAFFSMMIICYMVISLVMASMMSIFGIHGAGNGALFGFMIWIIAAAIAMTAHISSNFHVIGYFIDVAYQLIYLVLIGLILGAWRG